MNRIALTLYLSIGGLHLTGTLLASTNLIDLTKPLLMPLLLFYLYSFLNGRVKKVHLILAGAILLSWLGDLFLMRDDQSTFFMAGLAAFLLAHVLYIFVFIQSSSAWPVFRLTPLLPILTYGMFFAAFVLPNTQDLQLPVAAYLVIILGMTSTARLRSGYTSAYSYQMVFIGSLLFVCSDSILAYAKFLREIPLGSFFVMLTYMAAQLLICNGILKHHATTGIETTK